MIHQIVKTLALAVLVLAVPPSATGIVGTLPPKDANVLAPLQEAHANVLALLGKSVGDDRLTAFLGQVASAIPAGALLYPLDIGMDQSR